MQDEQRSDQNDGSGDCGSNGCNGSNDGNGGSGGGDGGGEAPAQDRTSANGFAALRMMVNCVDNAATLAYVNGTDLKDIMDLLAKVQGTLTDKCPCPCPTTTGEFVIRPLFDEEGCKVDRDCGDGFRCVENYCELDLSASGKNGPV